jgi:2-iminoacetate synthase ThiH
MTKDEIIAMIRNAGLEPVERDTLYNKVEREAIIA